MRKASRIRWLVQSCAAIVLSLTAFSVHAQLMLAHEGHHDGHGGCQVKSGDFPVTVSIYEVPEGNIPPMHSYCDHVPNIGKVNITIELPSDAREIPLAVRLVKEGHEEHGGHAAKADGDVTAHVSKEGDHDGHNAHHDGHDMASHEDHKDVSHAAEEQSGFYMPLTTYPSGIIVVATDLTELGQYSVLLEKMEGDTVRTAVRVPVHVGGSGGHGGHGGGFGMLETFMLLGVAGGVAFFFLRRKDAGKPITEKS